MSFTSCFSRSYKYLLPLGFFVIISIMVFTNFFAITLNGENSKSMVGTIQQNIYSDNLLKKMTQASFDRSLILSEMLQTNDPFKNDELFLELNTLATTYVTSRAKFESQDLDQHMQELLDAEGTMSNNLGALQLRIYELIQLDKKVQAVKIFNDKAISLQRGVHDIIHKMTKHQYASSQISIDKLKENNNSAVSNILILNLISISICIILTFFVINKQRKSDARLAQLANTDVLTNLPNRSSFKAFIDKSIDKSPEDIFSIVFFDIDHFKSINDNYGHEIGDKILRQYAAKIKTKIKEEDILSRFGGDEFVLLLRSINSKQDAIDFISKLSKDLDTSCTIDNKEIFITSSIGASIYSNNGESDGSSAKSLLKNADIAMYSAKESGRNCYQFFSIKTKNIIEKGHAITYALHKILKSKNANNELYMKFQPLLNIADNNIKECEALLRWKTKDGLIVSTAEFIAHAEKSNLIEKINNFVIDESCQQQKHWHELGVFDIKININLSGNKKIFAESLMRLDKKIIELGLSPSQFGIELTERTIMEVSEKTIQKLKKLRNAGMKIAIDDFGTGYSSLSYLKKLPITTIKIDKSFISDLPNDKDDRELVKTIITLGHSLNLDIVAEGVETIEQLDFLRLHNCDIAQGYYFHYPLKQDEMIELKVAA